MKTNTAEFNELSEPEKRALPHWMRRRCDRDARKAVQCDVAGPERVEPGYFLEAASFGASEATIFSKRGSPRNGSHTGLSLRSP
jgi:hypothetical protein